MLDWWLPENVSTYGRDIDWLFHLIYYICLLYTSDAADE